MPINNNRSRLKAAILLIPVYLIYGLMLRAIGTFLTMLARSVVPAYIVPTVGFQIAIPMLAQIIFTKLGFFLENKIYNMAEHHPNAELKQVAITATANSPRPIRSRFHELSHLPNIALTLATANIASPGILANDAKRYAIAAAGVFFGNMFKKGMRAMSSSSDVDNVPQLDNENNATRSGMHCA